MDSAALWNAITEALTSSAVLAIISSLYVISSSLVCLHVLQRPREATAALIWMFLAWMFPVAGPLLYLAFGVDRVPRKTWRKQEHDREFRRQQSSDPSAKAPPYARHASEFQVTMAAESTAGTIRRGLDAACPESPLLGGNQVELLLAGDAAYPRMLQAISEARRTIHFQSYIIRPGKIGRAFLKALAEKASEGVKVRMLYDKLGSSSAVITGFFRRYGNVQNFNIRGWTQANILKRQFQINLRNHRKLLVVDGKRAFIGGVNIHDDHILATASYPIQDYHFEVRGPIVHELQSSFLRDWYFITEESPRSLLTRDAFPPMTKAGGMPVHVIPSGPTDDEKDSLREAIFLMLISAKRRITAVTPYFVPTPDILRAFTSAAYKGVDVRLVLPMKNNHFYAGLAGRARYEPLLKAGVRIFERKPPFIHAKALTVDDAAAMVGTANLDVRSLRLNYETSIIAYDAGFSVTMRKAIEREITESVEILPAVWARRPAHKRLLENFCNLLTPTL